jgi:hypothetical protein
MKVKKPLICSLICLIITLHLSPAGTAVRWFFELFDDGLAYNVFRLRAINKKGKIISTSPNSTNRKPWSRMHTGYCDPAAGRGNIHDSLKPSITSIARYQIPIKTDLLPSMIFASQSDSGLLLSRIFSIMSSMMSLASDSLSRSS